MPNQIIFTIVSIVTRCHKALPLRQIWPGDLNIVNICPFLSFSSPSALDHDSNLQIYDTNIQRIWCEYRKNILNLNQDTLDVRLPQGAALIFQQKGMLHAGLGQNFHFLDYFLDFQIFMLHAGLGQNFHFLDYFLNFQIFMLHAGLGQNFHFLDFS